jgi:hypothetical protein
MTAEEHTGTVSEQVSGIREIVMSLTEGMREALHAIQAEQRELRRSIEEQKQEQIKRDVERETRAKIQTDSSVRREKWVMYSIAVVTILINLITALVNCGIGKQTPHK